MRHCPFGYLVEDAPARRAFPDGCVPLCGIQTVRGFPGEAQESEEFALIDLRECTAEQKEAMAGIMAELGQGSIEEARAMLAEETNLPIRDKWLAGKGVSFRGGR